MNKDDRDLYGTSPAMLALDMLKRFQQLPIKEQRRQVKHLARRLIAIEMFEDAGLDSTKQMNSSSAPHE